MHSRSLLSALIIGIAAASLALAGCSGTRVQTVTVPAGSPSVQPPTATDTVRVEQLPPVPAPGTPTAPTTVTTYTDTLQREALDLQRVTVDRAGEEESVTVQYEHSGETVEETFRIPAFGEVLDIQPADSGRSADAQVRGTPQDRDVEARVPEDDAGLWSWVTSRLALIGGLALLGAVTYILRTFTHLIPF